MDHVNKLLSIYRRENLSKKFYATFPFINPFIEHLVERI